MEKQLTAFLDSFLKMGVPGYDCIVYKNGQCLYRHQNGYASLEDKRPLTGKERYNVYSASKPLTCAAAMQLYEKKYFSLKDPLSEYMPEFAQMTVQTPTGLQKATKQILIQDLFQMTAGFGYDPLCASLQKAKKDTNGRCPTRETVAYLAQEPLLFEPGAHWSYGFEHDVLAGLIEVLTGQKFGQYVKQNIFDPLGMHHSTFLLPEEELDTIAPQYYFNNEKSAAENCGKQIRRYKLGSMYESGGAGCISTVEDYMKFLEVLRRGDSILKKETIRLMQTDRLNDITHRDFWHSDYGYGLGLRCPREGCIPSDFGWAGAVGIFLAVDPVYQVSVFHAQHILNPPNNGIKHQIIRIINDPDSSGLEEIADGERRLFAQKEKIRS